MRPATTLVLVLAATSLLLHSDQTRQSTSADPEGRWVGEYSTAKGRVFLLVQLRKDKERWSGTYNRPVLDWENDLDLKNLHVDEGRISFDIGEAPAIHIDARSSGGMYRGKAEGGGYSGVVVLEPTASLAKDYLDTLAGDYTSSSGADYVIERENSYLCFLNRRTGRTGRMLPVSERRFFAGPSLDIWYPQEIWFNFSRSSRGVEQMDVRELGGGRQRLARRALYRTEQVEFENGGVKLSGTLRLPHNAGRHAGVVLLHGSNYQTRGGQYAMLGFVADQFARSGFAVLTYDKRGTGKSGGARDDDPELLSGDAAAAVRLLRARPELDSSKIGLWGVSQGGILEPLVAQKVGNLAFFINVSGAVINTNLQEIQRTELKLRADGFPEGEIRSAVKFQQLKFRYACQRDNWEEYESALRAAHGKAWLPDPYIGPPTTKEDSAWDFWRCGVDPGKAWEAVRVPVLYVQGEHETYSKPAENLRRLQEAMKVAGNRGFERRLFAGAEHSMLRARNGGEKELPFLNRYVAGYFDELTSWASRKLR